MSFAVHILQDSIYHLYSLFRCKGTPTTNSLVARETWIFVSGNDILIPRQKPRSYATRQSHAARWLSCSELVVHLGGHPIRSKWRGIVQHHDIVGHDVPFYRAVQL